jgi:hypothetical protein
MLFFSSPLLVNKMIECKIAFFRIFAMPHPATAILLSGLGCTARLCANRYN